MDLNKYKIVRHYVRSTAFLLKETPRANGHPTAGVPVGADQGRKGYEVKQSQRLRLQLLETLREHSTALRTLQEGLRQRNDILYLISPSYL